MTLAVLVLSPESSGNRLMTRLLIEAGCYGDAGAGRQRLDAGIPPAQQPVVWLRSFPHGGKWADIPDMVSQLRLQGYTVKAVTLFRDFRCQRWSQVAVPHVVDDAHAKVRIREAYWRIFTGLAQAGMLQDYVPVVYESLIAHPVEVLTDLFDELGLEVSAETVSQMSATIVDGDAKYYEGSQP